METNLLNLDPAEIKALDKQAALMADYRRSIRLFIKDVWGLTPQGVKPQYRVAFETACRKNGKAWELAKHDIKAEWFGDYDVVAKEWVWYDFVKGKHFSWQQNIILMGVEKAIAGDGLRHLSIVSGHGIGKSAVCTWIILWFLYVYAESQVPVTAPTSAQMHDVLWKELSIWIGRMPQGFRELYDWTHDYVRMNYAPDSWFARARTSTKENTEAIAGVHADNVAIVVDEASGVPEQVFTTAQGALTSGNVLVVLISNGTRTIGYFFDSHHKNAESNQLFHFDSENSPIVDKKYIERMERMYGRESEEFKVRVSGGFPGEDMMDTSGYLQLIPEDKINVRLDGGFDIPFVGRKILGVDASGEGKDKTTYVLRDRFKAKKIFERRGTNDKEIAEDILTFIDKYNLDPADVVIGAFGTGANVGKEVALASARSKNGPYEIYTVMEGNAPKDEEEYNWKFFSRMPDEIVNQYPDDVNREVLEENKTSKTDVDMFLNIRALMYFRARKWLMQGGCVVDVSVDNSDFVNELTVIRYKRSLHGNKIQLMSKKEMKKLGIASPNIGDAFAITLLRELHTTSGQSAGEREAEDSDYDIHSAL